MTDLVERSMNRIAGSECDHCHMPPGRYHEYHCPMAIRDELTNLNNEFKRVCGILASKNNRYRTIARCLDELVRHLNVEFDLYNPDVADNSPTRKRIVEKIEQLQTEFEMLDTYI